MAKGRGRDSGIYQLEGVDQCFGGCPGDARSWGDLSCSEGPQMASGTNATGTSKNEGKLCLARLPKPLAGHKAGRAHRVGTASPAERSYLALSGQCPHTLSSQGPRSWLALACLPGLCTQSLLCQPPRHAHAIPSTENVFLFPPPSKIPGKAAQCLEGIFH